MADGPTPDEEALAGELARDIIREIAPQELPVFRAQAQSYFSGGTKGAEGRTKDEMLGFGVGDAVSFLTPYVLAVSTAVISYLVNEVRKSAEEEGASRIKELVQRFFKKLNPGGPLQEAPPAPSEKEISERLSDDQLIEVRRVVIEQGNRLKLPAEHSELLADAMVGRLVTAES